jgi:hypothetical protein
MAGDNSFNARLKLCHILLETSLNTLEKLRRLQRCAIAAAMLRSLVLVGGKTKTKSDFVCRIVWKYQTATESCFQNCIAVFGFMCSSVDQLISL